MPDKVHNILQATDPKVMATAGGSLVSWMIGLSKQFGPLIDVVAGLVAIGAGLMAIAWTAMRMYDRFNEKKRGSKD